MLIPLSEPIIYNLIDFVNPPEFFKIFIVSKNFFSKPPNVTFSKNTQITDLITLSKALPERQFTIKELYNEWAEDLASLTEVNPILGELFQFSTYVETQILNSKLIKCIDLSNIQYLELINFTINVNTTPFFSELKSLKKLYMNCVYLEDEISDSSFFDVLQRIKFLKIGNIQNDEISNFLEMNSFILKTSKLNKLVITSAIDEFTFKYALLNSSLIQLEVEDISSDLDDDTTKESNLILNKNNSCHQFNRSNCLKILKIGIDVTNIEFYQIFLSECVNVRRLSLEAHWWENKSLFEIFRNMKKLLSLTVINSDEKFDQRSFLSIVNDSCPNVKELLLFEDENYILISNLYLLQNLKYIRKLAITLDKSSRFKSLRLINENFKYISHLCLSLPKKPKIEIIKFLKKLVHLDKIFIEFLHDWMDDDFKKFSIGNSRTLKNEDWIEGYRFWS